MEKNMFALILPVFLIVGIGSHSVGAFDESDVTRLTNDTTTEQSKVSVNADEDFDLDTFI